MERAASKRLCGQQSQAVRFRHGSVQKSPV